MPEERGDLVSQAEQGERGAPIDRSFQYKTNERGGELQFSSSLICFSSNGLILKAYFSFNEEEERPLTVSRAAPLPH